MHLPCVKIGVLWICIQSAGLNTDSRDGSLRVLGLVLELGTPSSQGNTVRDF